MKAYFDRRQLLHRPRAFLSRGAMVPGPEAPERAAVFLAALAERAIAPEAPSESTRAELLRVHPAEYLDFLEHGHEHWRALPGAGPEIVPNVHPGRHMRARPDHIVGLAGWHMADAACPIGPDTWTAVRASADAALATARALLGGAREAYALCRPPGHHAFADLAGGFCYLNNVALAAEALCTRLARVAILDIDVHHGNGTQGIFYGRGDVLCVSVHADPARFYPWYAGYADERGTGAGEGANLNLPLAHGTGDDGYLAAIVRGLGAAGAFAPDAVLVSLGLDAGVDDPLGALAVTPDGFRRAGAAIGAVPQPVALVQEGGYLSPSLGVNLGAFIDGFLAAR